MQETRIALDLNRHKSGKIADEQEGQVREFALLNMGSVGRLSCLFNGGSAVSLKTLVVRNRTVWHICCLVDRLGTTLLQLSDFIEFFPALPLTGRYWLCTQKLVVAGTLCHMALLRLLTWLHQRTCNGAMHVVLVPGLVTISVREC